MYETSMKFSPPQSLATLTLSFIPRCNFIFLLSCGVYIFQKLSNPNSDLPRFQNDKVKQAKCISKYKPLSDGANILKPIENDLTSLSVILAIFSLQFCPGFSSNRRLIISIVYATRRGFNSRRLHHNFNRLRHFSRFRQSSGTMKPARTAIRSVCVMIIQAFPAIRAFFTYSGEFNFG